MAIQIGQQAPDFTLRDNEKNKVTLSDYRGRNVLLLFYPLAFTGTCTKELCYMRDNLARYNDMNALVFGISVDSLFAQDKFKKEQNLNFPLLSDFLDRKVTQAYGIYLPKYGIANRVTFVIDKEGKIDFIEQGGDAIKIMGAGDACSRLAHKKAQ